MALPFFLTEGLKTAPHQWVYIGVFNPLALRALPLYRCTTQGERRFTSITFTTGVFNPFPRHHAPQLSPIFSYENTGEKGNIRFGNEVEFYCFVTPRHVTGHGKGRRGVNLLLCVLRSKI